MPDTRRIKRVDVYRRPRGQAGEPFRFLLSEKPVTGQDVHVAARETAAELARQFPDYEFVLVVRLTRDPGRGGLDH
jgi:hypothetical protein